MRCWGGDGVAPTPPDCRLRLRQQPARRGNMNFALTVETAANRYAETRIFGSHGGGECWIPVPLPPPVTLRSDILRAAKRRENISNGGVLQMLRQDFKLAIPEFDRDL
jgi:hypothetical protein